MNEALNMGESAQGRKGVAASMAERLGLTGIYHAVCEGYKPQHEKEYMHLFPSLLALRQQRDSLVRHISVFSANMLGRVQQELDDLEAFMQSMTEVKWADHAPNVVTTAGANLALDTALAGSAYTVTGPYMFLIGAVSYTGVPVIGDTMAAHATWTEAGVTNAPTYTGPRKTVAWSAASGKSKSPSSAPVFTMTGAGTAKGVGIVFGAGAVATIDSTAGTLYSAGLFSGGDQVVANTNTLTVTYAAQA